MKEKLLTENMIVAQLEEALEERQKPDRRQNEKELPQNVQLDRRKKNRRGSKK